MRMCVARPAAMIGVKESYLHRPRGVERGTSEKARLFIRESDYATFRSNSMTEIFA